MRSFACLFLLAACGEPALVQKDDPAANQKAAVEDGHGPDDGHDHAEKASDEDPHAQAPKDETVRYGKVLEVLEGGERYVYARMDACGVEAWVAGPIAQGVAVGQTLAMKGGVGMVDFESKHHDRTFDKLLLVDAWKLADHEIDCSAPLPSEAPADLSDLEFGVAKQVELGAGYTFVKLEHCGKETWYAGPETPVKEGDQVAVPKGSVMQNFRAESLSMTFDAITFVQKYQRAKVLPPCE